MAKTVALAMLARISCVFALMSLAPSDLLQTAEQRAADKLNVNHRLSTDIRDPDEVAVKMFVG